MNAGQAHAFSSAVGSSRCGEVEEEEAVGSEGWMVVAEGGSEMTTGRFAAT